MSRVGRVIFGIATGYPQPHRLAKHNVCVDWSRWDKDDMDWAERTIKLRRIIEDRIARQLMEAA